MSEDFTIGDNRPARYTEERDGQTIVVYRASSLGSCDRALVASARKYLPSPKPDWFQEVLDEGHEAEPLIRAMYEERTETRVIGDQQECELELGEIGGKSVVVRGHTDGRVFGRATLFEAKKFRASTWDKFLRSGVECNVNYPWQVSTYMLALDLEECDFVGGLVSFDDWNNLVLDDIHIHHLAQPPINLLAIRKRVMRVEKLIETGFDPQEVECNKSMYPCPYYKLEDRDENEPVELPDTPEMFKLIVELSEATREASAAGKAKDKADRRKKELAAELRAELEKLGASAEAAKKLNYRDTQLTRIRKHVPAHQVKASDQDYFTIKPVKRESLTAEEES